MVELDITGVVAHLSDPDAVRLRDAAAVQAGSSAAHRDLALLLERALTTGKPIALQRGERRALEQLLTDDDLADISIRR